MFQLFPEKTSFDSLSEADFLGLITREVTEGVYIEFKSELPSNKKIASAIAGFANTHGGWLLIGIEEGPGGKVAACPGISASGADQAERMRNICRDSVAPFPAHTVRIATKPDGRILIAIEVPMSMAAPHVCSDGAIPIRIAASTQAINSANHYELGRIFSRSEKFKDSYALFAQDARRGHDLFVGPTLSLYIWPIGDIEGRFKVEDLVSPIGLSNAKDVLNDPIPIAVFESAREMVGDEESSGAPIPTGTSQIPFDSVYSHCGSLYFEQGGWGGLLAEFDVSGRYKVHLPLSTFDRKSKALESGLEPATAQILESAFNDGYSAAFDAAKAWQALAHFVSLYFVLLGNTRPAGGYRVSMELSGVAGMVPFVNHKSWVEHVSRSGFAKFHSQRRALPSSVTQPYGVAKDEKDLRSRSIWMTSLLLGVPFLMLWEGWIASELPEE